MTPLADHSGARGWFTGRRALVIGLGKSGAAAAALLAKLGARVTVTDNKAGDAVRSRAAGLPPGVEVEAGGHRRLGETWDLVVPSPGVPSALWSETRARG